MSNLVSEYINAPGLVRDEACHLTSIHGVCTTAGKVNIHNGLDDTAPVMVSFAFTTGAITVEEAPFS